MIQNCNRRKKSKACKRKSKACKRKSSKCNHKNHKTHKKSVKYSLFKIYNENALDLLLHENALDLLLHQNHLPNQELVQVLQPAIGNNRAIQDLVRNPNPRQAATLPNRSPTPLQRQRRSLSVPRTQRSRRTRRSRSVSTRR